MPCLIIDGHNNTFSPKDRMANHSDQYRCLVIVMQYMPFRLSKELTVVLFDSIWRGKSTGSIYSSSKES
jgi:hypothetical protein